MKASSCAAASSTARRTAIAALQVVACLSVQPAVAAEVLRFADSLPESHLFTRVASKPWMEAVTKATNGEVTFQHYPAEQLGKAKDMLSLVQSVADVGLVVPAFMTDKLPLSSVVDLPGAFTTSCDGARAYWTLAKSGILAKEELAPNGLRALFVIVQPPYAVYTSSKKIASAQDLSGLKLRAVGGMANLLVRELGGSPVNLSGPEIREAVSRGTVDGGIWADVTIDSYDLNALIKHRTDGVYFGSAALVYGISENRFKKLAPGVQTAMIKAGDEITSQACKAIDQNVSEALERMKRGGMTITSIPEAERVKLATVFDKVSKDWMDGLDKRGKPATRVAADFRAALKN